VRVEVIAVATMLREVLGHDGFPRLRAHVDVHQPVDAVGVHRLARVRPRQRCRLSRRVVRRIGIGRRQPQEPLRCSAVAVVEQHASVGRLDARDQRDR
jgi:hypothetical protein